MTEHNIFQEIDEDLERQKMADLWRRYGGYVVLAAIIIVVATGAITAWRSWRMEHNERATATLIDLKNPDATDINKQIDELAAYGQKNDGQAQATFAQLHAGALAAKQGDTAKAVGLYDAVANDSKADPAFRQLGTLLSVRTQLDSGDPVILEKRLQPLQADNAPWRYTAMEYEGYLALRAGDKTKAQQIFSDLSQNADVPHTLGARAADMLRYLGG